MQFSTRQTNFYTLLRFISFGARTSILYLTAKRTLHSILTRRISPVTAPNFNPNIVYFQLSFCCLVSDHCSRQKKPLWEWRWRPIDVLPWLFSPSCFVKKGVGWQHTTSTSSQNAACSVET